MTLQLSSDFSVPVTITSSQSLDRSGTAHSLAGRIDDVPLGRIAIGIHGDAIYASIHGAQLGEFEIHRTPGGDLEIKLLTSADDLPCADDHGGAADTDTDSLTSAPSVASPRSVEAASSNVVEDIAFFFNDQARVSLGGAPGVPSDSDDIRAKIQASIADANTALTDSNIPVTLRAISIAPVAYPYPANEGMARALAELRNTTDGVIDQVHAYRDLIGADIVSLWIDNGVEGGLANVNFQSTIGFKNAFNVIRAKNPTATVIHEIGHNHGGRHLRDGYASTPESYYPDSFAHYFTTSNGGAFVTVVASTGDASRKDAIRLLRFSAPELDYLGTPTGLSGSADDAATIRAVSSPIADFRVATGNTIPDNPAPDTTRPTIKLHGRAQIETRNSRVVLRGVARDDSAIDRVIYHLTGRQHAASAQGGETWKIITGPRIGRTVLKIIAIDTAGLKSRPAKVTIFRRR